MNMIERMAERMLSAFAPRATAAAASGCVWNTYCQRCGSSWKVCIAQYCNGVYRNGFCNECGSC
ncbi:MAG TPA: hypothetical protein VNO31_02765 [Umezawaea sp.]|nr:hypothetical protein [Umezawaea sp.]